MSTGSDLSDYYENGPFGQRYVIHLKSKDEICLHALTILQADLLPCFLPVYISDDDSDLLIDISSCTPLSSLKGKDLVYVRRHYKKLLTDFLCEILRSLDFSLDPSGICYLEEKLFYNRITGKIVCIYLPLKARIQGGSALSSSIREHAMDELLHVPMKRNWISVKAMEKLYNLFRSDDEGAAVKYIQSGLWDDSRSIPSNLISICRLWGVFMIVYVLSSRFIERAYAGTSVASVPNTLFLFCTLSVLILLLLHLKNESTEKKNMIEEKAKRRKIRNTQILFPSSDAGQEFSALDISSDPVQFFRIGSSSHVDPDIDVFTVWTNSLTLGSDADYCDHYIDHSSLALCHCMFGHDVQGFFVEALSEKKGTYLNRRRIPVNEKAYIEEGDIVGIGELEYKTHFVHQNGS